MGRVKRRGRIRTVIKRHAKDRIEGISVSVRVPVHVDADPEYRPVNTNADWPEPGERARI